MGLAGLSGGAGAGGSEAGEARRHIINGDAAGPRDYPMTGAVLLDVDGTTDPYAMPIVWCSSTLIAPDTVLLAGHCVDEVLLEVYFPDLVGLTFRWSPTADLRAHAGLSDAGWPADAVEAVGWDVHPGYDVFSLDTGIARNHDLGLLYLAEPQTRLAHAYVPTSEEDDDLASGDEVVVVGWGQQGPDYEPEAGTYGQKRMGESTVALVGSHEFQVGALASEVRQCHGDSGGPVFRPEAEGERVVGVASHAFDVSDCEVQGAVNTRVGTYLTWLDTQLRARCADGTRTWCEEPGLVYYPTDTGDEPGDNGGGGEGSGGDLPASDGGGGSLGGRAEGRACGCSSAPEGQAAWLVPVAFCLARRRGRASRRGGGSGGTGTGGCPLRPRVPG